MFSARIERRIVCDDVANYVGDVDSPSVVEKHRSGYKIRRITHVKGKMDVKARLVQRRGEADQAR
jgi:hypothetical protein